MHKVVITGIGVASPLGSWKGFKDGLREGRSAIRRISCFDPDGMRSQVAAEVDDSVIGVSSHGKGQRIWSRAALLAISAAREAFESAEMNPERFDAEQSMETAVFVGSGGGGVEIAEEQYANFFSGNGKKVSPFSIPASIVGMVSSEISIYFGLCGPSQVISTGCTSSSDAIGAAYLQIKSGFVRRALVGGADACITPGIVKGFDRMKATSCGFNDTPQKASRPFCSDRDGFVLGEGAWFFILERMEDAMSRGADIRGEIIGYWANCEAGHKVRMGEDGVWPAYAMKRALKNAKKSVDDVSYVSLHGTATILNDLVETRAMKQVFGKKAPGSSPKSMLGHPQGASGAMGLATALAGMEGSFLPPTINLDTPDRDCDLDYIPNHAREGTIEVALCNCIGFGSRNAALVVQKSTL